MCCGWRRDLLPAGTVQVARVWAEPEQMRLRISSDFDGRTVHALGGGAHRRSARGRLSSTSISLAVKTGPKSRPTVVIPTRPREVLG
ncbi:hypothetical protein ABIA33_002425 [Streptacidiphilus sp. MAP12-16]